MVDEAVALVVRRYLSTLKSQGIPVAFGVIFGSHAVGKAEQWSDIDLLVVSPSYDQERKRADINFLWRVAARTDSRIEPIPVGLEQYDKDDGSAIIEIARREGQVIPLAE